MKDCKHSSNPGVADNPDVSSFYSSVSRLYTSGFNSLTATIFGWLAFNGLVLNLMINDGFLRFKLPLIGLGVIIIIIAFYFYFRLMLFGHGMYVLERQFLSEAFLRSLPTMKIFKLVNPERKEVNSITRGEGISLLILVLLFFVPLLYYVSFGNQPIMGSLNLADSTIVAAIVSAAVSLVILVVSNFVIQPRRENGNSGANRIRGH